MSKAVRKRWSRQLFKLVLLSLLLISFVKCQDYLFQWTTKASSPEKVEYGVTFSYPFAQALGLDWHKAYQELLREAGLQHLRLPVYWDQVEPIQGQYRWSVLDWQLEQAALAKVKVLLILGHRASRYPECYMPAWVQQYDTVAFKDALLQLVKAAVEHFQQFDAVEAWQLENEPFASHWGLGCHNVTALLNDEIQVVKENDASQRPTVLTYFNAPWFLGQHRNVLKLNSDVIAATVFDKIWVAAAAGFNQWRLQTAIFNGYAKILHLGAASPVSLAYQKHLAQQRHKDLWVVELQAEPWGPDSITHMSRQEASQSMNPHQLAWLDAFVRSNGVSRVYFWGVEWILSQRQRGDDRMWNALIDLTKRV